MRRVYDAVMLLLSILILVLLFRVALGIHAKAVSFTGKVPGDLLPPSAFVSADAD